MAEKPYQKRELDYYFDELKQHLKKQDETLGRVEAQTTKTNGRVTKLEWNDKAFLWAVSAIWTLLLLGVPIGYMVLRYVVLNEIKLSVATEFKNYHAVVQINENN